MSATVPVPVVRVPRYWKVWRELVQQDKGGLVGLEQAGPVGLVEGLGAQKPEPLEGFALAQLVGDFTHR